MRRLHTLALLFSASVMAAEVPVTVAPLASLAIQPERSAPATVESLNNADLSAEISARVLDFPVRVGDRVATGDLLVQLDCRDHESRLTAQRATLAQIESQRRLALGQLERARSLRRDRNVSDEEVDRRASELDVADAQVRSQAEAVRQAQLNAERCEVRAPFDAVVTRRLIDVGVLASPGSPLVRLVQLDELEVSAHVRPAEVEEGAAAGRVDFVYLGTAFPLSVRRVLPVVDPTTRTVEVRLVFTGEKAPPGASGRLTWRSRGLHVPADLLVRRGADLGVFAAEGGRANFHPVPEALEGQPARLNLPGTSLIVVEGRQGLQDGEPVAVAEQGS